MIKTKARAILTIIMAAAITVSSIPLNVYALPEEDAIDIDVSDTTREVNITIDTDGLVQRAENTAANSKTGAQTDARAEEENRKSEKNDEDELLDRDIPADEDSFTKSQIPEAEIVWEEIHIKTADDFLTFAHNCQLDAWSHNKKVYLDDDISLTDSPFYGVPIFGGYFDGKGHTISNVLINTEESYLGVFSRIEECGVVRDLNISGRVTPMGAQTIIGSLAGDNAGIISGCSFNGVVSGEDYVGGIAGINELSGIIMDSTCDGVISGVHFTGGIAGENMGNILRCRNNSGVNIADKETAMSIEDISVDSILSAIGLEEKDKDNAEAAAMINGVVDMGGIAGVSIGVIEDCVNEGRIGYTNVGYNVGGIVGRQSGYVYSCTNNGSIQGRKDVGGIVGQAEPYVTIDFADSVTQELSENITKLHDSISVTLKDAGSESDTISSRLSVIQMFANGALEDTRYIENQTIDWANGMISAGNQAISRVDYILDESAKKDGLLDQTGYAAKNAQKALEQFRKTVGDLDIYEYMSDAERERYDNAKRNLESAMEEHAGYEDEVADNYYNYYIHYYKSQDIYNGTSSPSTAEFNEQKLAFKRYEDGGYMFREPLMTDDLKPQDAPHDKKSEYDVDGQWVQEKFNVDGSDAHFPGENGDDQQSLDESLINAASSKAEAQSLVYADAVYYDAHGTKYTDDISNYSDIMAGIIYNHLGDMTEASKSDAQKALKTLEKSAANVENAAASARSIIDNINERPDITLPGFCDEYKQHANSLTNNIQGMSDNFGFLNQEMNGASNHLVSDLQNVNDQFNNIMQLFTDAIDGVLSRDYSNTYEDESYMVAEDTTDATVAACTNNGTVDGSIDVAGICGTMAIEYDFDLESDVTGIKDSVMNATYRTKCVLRRNVNRGKVSARKNYIAGICGQQEMGTIIRCENYDRISTDSGSYVGGIAGKSVSNILRSYSKCTLSGHSYVGGIAGEATNIRDCLSMVKITDAVEWYGAIAGHGDGDFSYKNNYYIGSDLAGVDRVSYAGSAEPISYSYAREMISGIPSYFDNVYIYFCLDVDEDSDDDEEVLLGKKAFSYGQPLESSDYPDVPVRPGYYPVWDVPSMDAILYDDVITASYVRNNTTLAGDIVRQSNQSAILVDGAFMSEDALWTVLCVGEADALPDCQEYWNISIPDDGQTSHMVRYMKADNMEGWPEIYVNQNGSWQQISDEQIGMMGAYETFYVNGNDVKLQMIYSGHKSALKRKIIMAVCIAVAALLLVLIIVLIKKNHKKVHTRVRERAQDTRERIANREPAIKFLDEKDIEQLDEEDDGEVDKSGAGPQEDKKSNAK